jgi:ubiquinone/menaquinone biosynthesis C-methylase UbiE
MTKVRPDKLLLTFYPKPFGKRTITMRRFLLIMNWLSFCLALMLTTTKAQDIPKSQGPAPYPAEMNKKFTDPNMDIQEFVKRFENEARDIYVKRREIARALNLRPGNAVADIGAGTGLFTQLFAEQVGPKGTVYAVDIGPAFVKYIAEQAKQQGQERIVKTVLNTPDSTELAPGSIDVAFICDTYHHFEHPEKMLVSIHRALRPGGRLVVIDFDLRKDSGEFVKQRARAAKEVYFLEITAAGFEPIEAKNAPAIKDNFYAEFQRVESKSQVQSTTVTDRLGTGR